MRKAMVSALIKLGRDCGLAEETEEGEPALEGEALAWAYLCFWTLEGKTVKALADRIGFSDALLRMWIKQVKDRDEACASSLELARVASADAHVDNAVAILDAATPIESGVAGQRARIRQWLATRRDPKQYADQKAVAAPISIGNLYLQAMTQQLPAQATAPDRSDTVTIPVPQLEG